VLALNYTMEVRGDVQRHVGGRDRSLLGSPMVRYSDTYLMLISMLNNRELGAPHLVKITGVIGVSGLPRHTFPVTKAWQTIACPGES
jgi:hypothetical protein